MRKQFTLDFKFTLDNPTPEDVETAIECVSKDVLEATAQKDFLDAGTVYGNDWSLEVTDDE